jgi:hypothetical protein
MTLNITVIFNWVVKASFVKKNQIQVSHNNFWQKLLYRPICVYNFLYSEFDHFNFVKVLLPSWTTWTITVLPTTVESITSSIKIILMIPYPKQAIFMERPGPPSFKKSTPYFRVSPNFNLSSAVDHCNNDRFLHDQYLLLPISNTKLLAFVRCPRAHHRNLDIYFLLQRSKDFSFQYDCIGNIHTLRRIYCQLYSFSNWI